MNNEEYISYDDFNKIVDMIEYIDSFSKYGRKNLKHHIRKLQQDLENCKAVADTNLELAEHYHDIINKITNYCKFQIEKDKDKFPQPLESEKWLKGRISAFKEILEMNYVRDTKKDNLINYLKEQINECKLIGNDEDYIKLDVYNEILSKIEMSDKQ